MTQSNLHLVIITSLGILELDSVSELRHDFSMAPGLMTACTSTACTICRLSAGTGGEGYGKDWGSIGFGVLLVPYKSCSTHSQIVQYKMNICNTKFQNLKLFECWHAKTNRKFHMWLHMMGHSQNAGTLEIWYKLPSGYVSKACM
jgi:hypothetical protein